MSARWHDLGYSNRQVVAADASSRNISWANINSVHFYIQQTWLFIEALKNTREEEISLNRISTVETWPTFAFYHWFTTVQCQDVWYSNVYICTVMSTYVQTLCTNQMTTRYDLQSNIKLLSS